MPSYFLWEGWKLSLAPHWQRQWLGGEVKWSPGVLQKMVTPLHRRFFWKRTRWRRPLPLSRFHATFLCVFPMALLMHPQRVSCILFIYSRPHSSSTKPSPLSMRSQWKFACVCWNYMFIIRLMDVKFFVWFDMSIFSVRQASWPSSKMLA